MVVHPEDTNCVMTHIVMPGHLNALDSVFGGVVMSWIDVCAAVSAKRFTRNIVVTASMDHLSFRAPIKKGAVAVVQSRVNWAGRTSMEVGVRVESEDLATGARTLTSKAYLTFVALDADGKPRPVPELAPQTEQDHRRFADAMKRRELRLKLRP